MAASFETNRGYQARAFFRPTAAPCSDRDFETMDGAGTHFRLTFDKTTEFYQQRESGLSGTRTKACYVLVFMVIILSLA
jgi:hypothetical protein